MPTTAAKAGSSARKNGLVRRSTPIRDGTVDTPASRRASICLAYACSSVLSGSTWSR